MSRSNWRAVSRSAQGLAILAAYVWWGFRGAVVAGLLVLAIEAGLGETEDG